MRSNWQTRRCRYQRPAQRHGIHALCNADAAEKKTKAMPEFAFTASQEQTPEWIVRRDESDCDELDSKQPGRGLASKRRGGGTRGTRAVGRAERPQRNPCPPGGADHFRRAAETLRWSYSQEGWPHRNGSAVCRRGWSPVSLTHVQTARRSACRFCAEARARAIFSLPRTSHPIGGDRGQRHRSVGASLSCEANCNGCHGRAPVGARPRISSHLSEQSRESRGCAAAPGCRLIQPRPAAVRRPVRRLPLGAAHCCATTTAASLFRRATARRLPPWPASSSRSCGSLRRWKWLP